MNTDKYDKYTAADIMESETQKHLQLPEKKVE